MFVGDEVMKGCIASGAVEAVEIASCLTLIQTARKVVDEETALVCEDILHGAWSKPRRQGQTLARIAERV